MCARRVPSNWKYTVVSEPVEGYRANAGICVFDSVGRVLAFERLDQHTWQFPQGGIDHGETPRDAGEAFPCSR
jgi:8-oxo-dGTP pyrophosphatase MutT (NUDIX family)